MNFVIGNNVPWNAVWSGEQRYEIRPCRWVQGRLALWSPHAPGEGTPVFAKPHTVRQRRAIAEMRCSVCGDVTAKNDRWWFKLGRIQEGYLMTTESPVHKTCADHALKVCPHLRGREQDLEPLPAGYSILSAILGGAEAENDFGVTFGQQRVIGALKLAWPMSMVEVRKRP